MSVSTCQRVNVFLHLCVSAFLWLFCVSWPWPTGTSGFWGVLLARASFSPQVHTRPQNPWMRRSSRPRATCGPLASCAGKLQGMSVNFVRVPTSLGTWHVLQCLAQRTLLHIRNLFLFLLALGSVWCSYGALPYGSVKNMEVQLRVRNGLRLEQPAGCHDAFYKMMLLCWDADWKSRPSFAILRKRILVCVSGLKDKGEKVYLYRLHGNYPNVCLNLNGGLPDLFASVVVPSGAFPPLLVVCLFPLFPLFPCCFSSLSGCFLSLLSCFLSLPGCFFFLVSFLPLSPSLVPRSLPFSLRWVFLLSTPLSYSVLLPS